VHLVVSRVSESAAAAIESAGGSVVARYYTATTLRALVKPHTFLDAGKLLPRPADPSDKRDVSELLSVAR
jgi:large subunit ribosomal protein L15